MTTRSTRTSPFTRPTPPRRVWLAALAAFGLTAVATLGCTTAPTTDSGAYMPRPSGTVLVYHRTSSGSYGAADGPVTWTLGEREWNGRRVVASVSPQGGTSLLDPQTHRSHAHLAPDGRPTFSWDPPVGPRYPMTVGQRWTDQHRMTVHARGQTVPLEVRYHVEAFEPVTVPAGTFPAYRVAIVDSFGETTTLWTAPAQGLGIVKRVLERPATHPMGAGWLQGVLTSVTAPK